MIVHGRVLNPAVRRPHRRPERRLSRLLPVLVLLLGALGLFAAAPVQAQAAKTWEANPQGYTVEEGVSARIVIRLSEAAPAGGLSFTLKPLYGSAVPSDKCVHNRKASAADVGANPPTTLTVPGGSDRAEVAIPTAHDLVSEFDECLAVQFAGAQATVNAGWTADTEDGPYGDSSAAQVVIFNITPPAAPTALKVTPGGDRLDVSWTAPSGSLRGYHVHYTAAAARAVGNHDAASGNDPAAAWVAVSRSGTTAAQAITGLTGGTAYRVRLRAVGYHRNPGFWAFGTGEPVETTAAGAPTGLRVTTGSGELSLSWTAPAAGVARSYDVHYTSSTTAGINDAASGSDPTAAWVDAGHAGRNAWHRIDGLTDGTAYRVRVRAVNAAGNSAWVRGTGTPVAGAPGVPPGLSVGAEHRKLNLRWRKPAGTVTDYDVHYTASATVGNDAEAGTNFNPAAGWVDAGHTAGVSQAISGLTNGTAYRVRVRAWNANGASAWARGTGTPLPVMGFSNQTGIVLEGKTETITVKLSAALAVAATVRLTIDATRPATARATETADFTRSATTLSFPAGTTEQTFTIRALADRTTEGNEYLFLRLTAPDGAAYRVGELNSPRMYDFTEITILDASRNPGLTIRASSTVPEGDSDRVLVELGSPAPAGGTAVTLSLANVGTATEGTDFRLSSKTATIAAGELWAEVTLTALDDSADDDAETVVLEASSTNPAHTASARTVTIVDDDVPAPQNVKVAPGSRPLTLTVTWEVPAAATTVDPNYAVYWSFRKKGTGPGWPRRRRATPEERTARRLTLADSRLSAAPHEVKIWFVYTGEADPVAAPGVVQTVESRPATALGTPRPPVPPSVPRNVQLVPGDAVLTLLWQAPSSVGSFELAGYEIETAGVSPHWEFIHDQIFDWRDPSATRARLKGLVINYEYPKNGNRYSVRIRAWTARAGAQTDEEGHYLDEDVAKGGWVTVTGTPMAGLNDRPTSLVLTDTSGGHVTEDVGTVPLTATLNAVALSDTTVSLTAADASTATATDDYTLSAETLTIAAGKRSATATLTIVDDAAIETDEVIQLSAATAGDVVLTSKALAITIHDDDEAPAAPGGLTVTAGHGELALAWTAPSGAVSGYDAQYKEAAAGDAPATTAGDPATGWVDGVYTGSTYWTITGLTNGIAYDVRVRATNADGESAWVRGTGTPASAAPAVPLGLSVAAEHRKLNLRWRQPAGTVTGYDVHYTASTTVGNDAEAGTNASPAAGWVDAGHTTGVSQAISSLTNGTAYRVRVRAWNASGAGAWARGTGTPLPIMGFDRDFETAKEGETETVTVKLSEALHSDTTVSLVVDTTRPATGRATETADFTLSVKTLAFAAGATEQTVTVRTVADRTTEGGEHFLLGLAAPDGAPYRVGKVLTQSILIFDEIGVAIADSSRAPGLHIKVDDTVGEGASAKVVVQLGSPAPVGGTAVTLSLGAGTATEGIDFRLSSKTATIAAGELSAEVTLTALDDSADDDGETVVLTASSTNPQHTTQARTVTIVDNDLPPVPAEVTLRGPRDTVAEGSRVQVRLALTKAPVRDVTIPLTVTRGTSEDGDHGNLAGITIPAGGLDGVGHIWTAVDGDADDETFTVALDTASLPPGVTAGSPASVDVTISDHGMQRGSRAVPTVSLYAWPDPVAEGAPVRVRARLSAVLGDDVTIPLTVTRDTSEAGDHGTLVGITIPSGYLEAIGEITTVVDADADDEMFTVALDTANLPSGVTAGPPSMFGESAATVIITDNGVRDAEHGSNEQAEESQAQHTPTPVVTLTAGGAVTEGTAAAFTLTAAPAPAADLAVAVSISQRGDVAETSALGARTVTIPAGTASTAFTVATVDDAANEADGAVEASLAGGNGYTVGDAAHAALAVADNDTPVVTVSAGAAVTEGAPAGFTLTAEPVPAADLAVGLSITQSGHVAQATALGTRTVTIPAGSASAAFTVATVDDAVDEPDGSVTATLTAGADYTVGAAGSATVAVADNDEPLPGILTKRGIAREGTDEAVVFTVRLSHAAAETVTVDYATADGAGVWASTAPATAGADYTATSGTLTFATGETWKSVAVPILDDAIDEGTEYFLLRFSNPQGATLAAGERETQGLIRNDDHLQAMWLARFGRTVGTQVTDAVSERLEAGLSSGVHATLAGQQLELSRADDDQALAETLTGLARAFGGSDAAFPQSPKIAGAWNDPPGSASSRSVVGGELLLDSSFHLATEGERSGPVLAAWGRMEHGRFDGEHADDTGRTRVDGQVLTGVLGADADFGRLLAGMAISLSEGDGAFDSPGVDVGARGGIESTMTTVSPYARFRLTERTSAWGLVGVGTGDMTIRFDDDGMAPIRIDTGLRMGALGARGALLEQHAAGGMDLALRADAFFVRIDSQQTVNSVATDAASSRVRLVLESGRRFNLGGGATLRPSLELGLRHDGGDAETGAGVELGGGVTYADAALGLSIEVRARMLVAHADSDYEEWGASATARLDPGERGQGLSLSLSPAIGATASAAERLWGAHEARGMAPGGAAFEAVRGLHAEVGYGLALFGNRVTGTPNLGVALSDGGAQDWRIGWRLTPAVLGDRGFEVNVDATRRQAAHDNGAEHGMMLRGAMRW